MNIDSRKEYSCVEIQADTGEEFQEYIYEDNSFVQQGEPVGVEITQNGITELFLYDGILFSPNPRPSDRGYLTQQLVDIRKNWTERDFKEAYSDEWDFMPDNLEEMFERMGDHIFHTYDIDYIKECIEEEK